MYESVWQCWVVLQEWRMASMLKWDCINDWPWALSCLLCWWTDWQIKPNTLNTIMFADDIVIFSVTRGQVEENLEKRSALERRGMKVSCSKTEYMFVWMKWKQVEQWGYREKSWKRYMNLCACGQLFTSKGSVLKRWINTCKQGGVGGKKCKEWSATKM